MLDRIHALARDLKAHLIDSSLASFEDADYFRQLYRKKAVEPEPIIPTIISKPNPPPAYHFPTPAPEPKPAPIFSPPITPETPRIHREPPPAREQNEANRSSEIATKPNTTNLNVRSITALLAKIAPDFPVLHEIPSDEKAQKIANRWKTKNQSSPISILSCGEPPEHQMLLEQIAKAIDVYFGNARLIRVESIEKEKQWEAFLSVADLKLILCCDYTLWQMGNLMKHFKEVPAASTRHLGKVPLFLLPDLSLYLKDPLLKRSLWKALCQTISSL